MPPPAAVVCELCGGKFSKHSLPIHQKACVVKRELSTSFCPVCDCLVSNDEYSAHVGECKKLNGAAAAEIKKANEAKKAKASKEKGKTLGGGAAAAEPAAAAEGEKKPQRSKIPESVLRRLEAFKNGEAELSPDQKLLKELGVEPCLACGKPKAAVACVGCHAVYCKPCSDMIHEVNKALSNHTPVVKAELAALVEGPVEDYREPCPVCERKFDVAKIARHRLVCTRQSRAKPRKSFKSAHDNRVKGTDFEKYEKAAAAAEKPAAPSKWRQQHAVIMALAGVSEAEAAAAVAAALEKAAGTGDPGAALRSPTKRAALGLSNGEGGKADPSVASSPSSITTMGGVSAATSVTIAPPSSASEPLAAVDTSMTSASGRKEKPLAVGDKVVLMDRGLWAVLQYRGPVWGLKPKGAKWAGLEFMDAPHGKNDGSAMGTTYFYCKENFGLFVPPDRIRRFVEGEVLRPGQSAVEAIVPEKPATPAAVPAPIPAPAAASKTASAYGKSAAAPGKAAVPATASRPASAASTASAAPKKAGVLSQAPAAKAATPAAAAAPGAAAASGLPPRKAVLPGKAAPAAPAATAAAAKVAAAASPAKAGPGSRPASAAGSVTGAKAAVPGAKAAAPAATVAGPKGPAPPAPPAAMSGPGAAAAARAAAATAAIARAAAAAAAAAPAPVEAKAPAPVEPAPAAAVETKAPAPSAPAKAVAPAPAAKPTSPASAPVLAPVVDAAPAASPPQRARIPQPGQPRASGAARTPPPVTGGNAPLPALAPAMTRAERAAKATAEAAAKAASAPPAEVAGPAVAAPAVAPAVVAVPAVAAAPVSPRPAAPSDAPAAEAVKTVVTGAAARPWLKKLNEKLAAAGGLAAVVALGAASAAPLAVAEAASPAPAAAAAPASPQAAAPTRVASDESDGSARFTASLVSRLRKKVEGERPSGGPASGGAGGRLVAEVRARQAAAAAAGEAPAEAAPSSSPRSRPSSATADPRDSEDRQRAIDKSVDFMRVLAGQKKKLAPEIKGEGAKLGGEDAVPSGYVAAAGALGADGKRRVVVDGRVQVAKGLSDTAAERAKRLAALSARQQPAGAGAENVAPAPIGEST